MLFDYLVELIKQFFSLEETEYPKFLKKYEWRPSFILFSPANKTYIAFDVIFNQNIPKKLYEEEVIKVIKDNSNLRVCLLSSLEYEYENLKIFCKKFNLGLKIYSRNSVNTIIPLDFEKTDIISYKKAKKIGWFPKSITNEIKKIQKIQFRDILINLASKLEKTQDEDKQLFLIKKSIDKILKNHQNYIGDKIPFMTLSNFENLLKFSGIDCSDHVFHSVRVFLTGCIIIDKYYEKFLSYYKDILGDGKISVEYIWLLCSIFHDIGRIRQDITKFIMNDPRAESPQLEEILRFEMNEKWKDDKYRISLCNITKLIEQSCKTKKDRDIPFTGYALGGPINEEVSTILVEHYNKRNHAVVSCFDLTADLFRKKEALKIKGQTFFLYHVIPAAMSIALHDWRIWEELAKIKIFPINMEDFPLAALLIYIDTWDDYKRKNDDERITIEGFTFTENNVITHITWHKKEEYLDEKVKYDSFERNVLFGDLRLTIDITNKKVAK